MFFSVHETCLCTFTVTQFWLRLILLKLELLKEAWFYVMMHELCSSWWKVELVMHGCVHALLALQSMKLMTIIFKVRAQRWEKMKIWRTVLLFIPVFRVTHSDIIKLFTWVPNSYPNKICGWWVKNTFAQIYM